MQRHDLELKIHDYIKTTYQANYIGFLEVVQEGTRYTFSIGMPSYMALTTINYDGDDDIEFLDFIYEELRTRNYMRLEIYKVVRTNDTKEEQ